MRVTYKKNDGELMTIFMFLYTNISRVPTEVSTSCSDASQWTEERDKKQTWQSVYSRKRDTKVENLSMIYENIFYHTNVSEKPNPTKISSTRT
jgi:hypothetical protein